MIPEMFSNMNITLVIKYNNLHTNTINLPRHCKIFHIKLNYFSGSFQICKEAMHIDSLGVNGMSVKCLYLSGAIFITELFIDLT